MKKEIPAVFIFILLIFLLLSCSKGPDEQESEKGGDQSSFIIAYCYQPNQNGIHQIFSIHPDGSNNQRVIDAPIGLNHHDCSSDGAKYAAVGYVGEGFSTWSIHVFNADGTNLTRLTTEEEVWDSEPAWSADGKRLVFTRIYPQKDHREEIWLMNADGSNRHFIGVEGFAAKWSPDGTKFIYTSKKTGKYEIYTCTIEGTDEVRLSDTAADETFPCYSPDGRQIAYCVTTGIFNTPENAKTSEIYLMNSDGTGIHRLTENESCDMYPRWSPDGSSLVFTSDRHEKDKWEVYLMDKDGTNVRRVTNSPPMVTAINPTWKTITK